MKNQQFSDYKNNPVLPPEPARTPIKLSRNPNQAMQEMMSIIDKLRTNILEETQALKETDTPRFLDLQNTKIDVARDYMEGVTQIMARKDEMKKADPKLIDQLEKMRLEFADIAHENHAAINRMKNGMKRLGERIMENAREAARREEEFIYSPTGRMRSGSRATIGVNESA